MEGGLGEVERVGGGTTRTGGVEAHVAAECGWAVGLEEGGCTSLPSFDVVGRWFGFFGGCLGSDFFPWTKTGGRIWRGGGGRRKK